MTFSFVLNAVTLVMLVLGYTDRTDIGGLAQRFSKNGTLSKSKVLKRTAWGPRIRAAIRVDIESRFGGHLADFSAKPEPIRGPAAELWRRTLLRIPTHFGRLVFLSSLREALTGRYTHLPLNQIVGQEVTDRTLRHSHHEIFSEWLGFSLAQQKADLDEYLVSTGGPFDLASYRDITPGNAHHVERQLYLTDLETLLELVRFERGAAFHAPTA